MHAGNRVSRFSAVVALSAGCPSVVWAWVRSRSGPVSLGCEVVVWSSHRRSVSPDRVSSEVGFGRSCAGVVGGALVEGDGLYVEEGGPFMGQPQPSVDTS